MSVRFSWDPRKAAGNLRKHGVSFREAASAFADPLSITIPDGEHSGDEDRFLLIRDPSRTGHIMKKSGKTAVPRVRVARRRGTDDVGPEYDFSRGVRGKYAQRVAEGTNLVLLDPDVAAQFRSARAVNRALRDYLKLRPR